MAALASLFFIFGMAVAQQQYWGDPPPPESDHSYRAKCGIWWEESKLRLHGLHGIQFPQHRKGKMIVSKQFVVIPPEATFPIRIGLEWGDEIININGMKDLGKVEFSKFFANLQKNNYIIVKRKGQIKMVKFTCPLKGSGN
jgi:hypothetical protein